MLLFRFRLLVEWLWGNCELGNLGVVDDVVEVGGDGLCF